VLANNAVVSIDGVVVGDIMVREYWVSLFGVIKHREVNVYRACLEDARSRGRFTRTLLLRMSREGEGGGAERALSERSKRLQTSSWERDTDPGDSMGNVLGLVISINRAFLYGRCKRANIILNLVSSTAHLAHPINIS
jgi:hypothetical protein